MWGVAIDLTEVERTVKEHGEELCAKKLDHPGEMGTFLGTYKLPNLGKKCKI